MAVKVTKGQLSNGTISKITCIEKYHLCGKFHGFMKKCTILWGYAAILDAVTNQKEVEFFPIAEQSFGKLFCHIIPICAQWNYSNKYDTSPAGLRPKDNTFVKPHKPVASCTIACWLWKSLKLPGKDYFSGPRV